RWTTPAASSASTMVAPAAIRNERLDADYLSRERGEFPMPLQFNLISTSPPLSSPPCGTPTAHLFFRSPSARTKLTNTNGILVRGRRSCELFRLPPRQISVASNARRQP